MAFGTTSRFRLLSCLLALFWTLLPVLSAAQCVPALPTPQAAARPAKPQTAPRCPMCAKMALGEMQMPGMAGMKCCCHNGNAPMFCRCGVQPAPKPAAILSALVWSPHALLPAIVRVLPPASSGCAYPGVFAPLLPLPHAPLSRPPRLL